MWHIIALGAHPQNINNLSSRTAMHPHDVAHDVDTQFSCTSSSFSFSFSRVLLLRTDRMRLALWHTAQSVSGLTRANLLARVSSLSSRPRNTLLLLLRSSHRAKAHSQGFYIYYVAARCVVSCRRWPVMHNAPAAAVDDDACADIRECSRGVPSDRRHAAYVDARRYR